MSRDGSIAFDWADDSYRFCLRIGELRELQEKRDAGPLELFNRIVSHTWRVDDLREIIRLGLIGGGMQPVEALRLVRAYVDPPRPLMESVDPALAILTAALRGVDDEQPGKTEAAETAPDPTPGSPSPPSTVPAP